MTPTEFYALPRAAPIPPSVGDCYLPDRVREKFPDAKPGDKVYYLQITKVITNETVGGMMSNTSTHIEIVLVTLEEPEDNWMSENHFT